MLMMHCNQTIPLQVVYGTFTAFSFGSNVVSIIFSVWYYAMLCMVDNLGNGVEGAALTVDAFFSGQEDNRGAIESATRAVLQSLDDAAATPRATTHAPCEHAN